MGSLIQSAQVETSNPNSDTISIVDVANDDVTKVVPVGNQPTGIAYNANNGDVYVTN